MFLAVCAKAPGTDSQSGARVMLAHASSRQPIKTDQPYHIIFYPTNKFAIH